MAALVEAINCSDIPCDVNIVRIVGSIGPVLLRSGANAIFKISLRAVLASDLTSSNLAFSNAAFLSARIASADVLAAPGAAASTLA